MPASKSQPARARRAIRWTAGIAAAGLLVLLTTYGYLLWINNRSIEPPSPASLRTSFERAIAWLATNRAKIYQDRNPALWAMLARAAEISRHPGLMDFYAGYRDAYVNEAAAGPWLMQIDRNARVPLPPVDLQYELADYQVFLLYGASCDAAWGSSNRVRAQLNADFCGMSLLGPACVTHQLTAIRLMQDRGCGDEKQLADIAGVLRKRIRSQLFWDVRVVDVYIQRLLMLAEGGDTRNIKPQWIARFLDAQEPDGGWDNFQPVARVAGERHFGFTSRGLGFQDQKSTLHATAQGALLLALLVNGGAVSW